MNSTNKTESARGKIRGFYGLKLVQTDCPKHDLEVY